MPDYYILGSKRLRDGKDWEDNLPAMIKQELLEVGWGWERPSLKYLYGRPEEDIASTLKKLGESPASYNALKLFLNLRPGDLVAIKTSGAPKGRTPCLIIHGYAQVFEKNGSVYRRGTSPLNHCVNAKFLDRSEHTFKLGYGGTIHRLTDARRISEIFAPVLNGEKVQLEPLSPARREQWLRKAALLKDVETEIRETKASKIEIEKRHHEIRNRLFKRLVKEHGEKNVFMERDFVDIQVSDKNRLVLYEIKPYDSVSRCIREALGQVLMYAWRGTLHQTGRARVVVVGPKAPEKEERAFIEFVKRTLKIDFDYLPFE